MKFANKNGIISPACLESDSMILNSKTSLQYTPKKDTNNSTNFSLGIPYIEVTDLIIGNDYYVEGIFFWDGFITDTVDNFTIYAQGNVLVDGTWTWNTINYITHGINKVLSGETTNRITSLVLSTEKGAKPFSICITADVVGYHIGLRTDYSNGIGTAGFRNVKIIPKSHKIGEGISSAKLYNNNEIILNEIIEI